MPANEIATVVLAAGIGRRLRPLTTIRPKPLCPINNVLLIELAFTEVAALVGSPTPEHVAVNVHHLADQVIEQVGARVHISDEQPLALGTAGAVGNLRGWIDGRDVLIRNTDVWRGGEVPVSFVSDWDRARPRLLVTRDETRADFAGDLRFAGLSLLPASIAGTLPAAPAGLYEAVWEAAARNGAIELVETDVPFIDCGTPSDYLRANLAASGGLSVVGEGASIDGELVRSVVWPGGVVARNERLVEVIRAAGDITVPAPQ
jgi:MurNAc alpha-1-phosphate uridylyltransferase